MVALFLVLLLTRLFRRVLHVLLLHQPPLCHFIDHAQLRDVVATLRAIGLVGPSLPNTLS